MSFAEQNLNELVVALTSYGFKPEDNGWLYTTKSSGSSVKLHISKHGGFYQVHDWVSDLRHREALALLGIYEDHEVFQALYPTINSTTAGPITADDWLDPPDDQSDQELGQRIMRFELGLSAEAPARMPREWACWRSAPAVFKYTDHSSKAQYADCGSWAAFVVAYHSIDDIKEVASAEVMFYQVDGVNISRQRFEFNDKGRFRSPKFTRKYYKDSKAYKDGQLKIKPKRKHGMVAFGSPLNSKAWVLCEGIFTAAAVRESIEQNDLQNICVFAASNYNAMECILGKEHNNDRRQSGLLPRTVAEAKHILVVPDVNDPRHVGEKAAKNGGIIFRKYNPTVDITLHPPFVDNFEDKLDARDKFLAEGPGAIRDMLDCGIAPEDYDIPVDMTAAYEFAAANCGVVKKSGTRLGTPEFIKLAETPCSNHEESNRDECGRCIYNHLPDLIEPKTSDSGEVLKQELHGPARPATISFIPEYVSKTIILRKEGSSMMYDLYRRRAFDRDGFNWEHAKEPSLRPSPGTRQTRPTLPNTAYPLHEQARIVYGVHNHFTGPLWDLRPTEYSEHPELSINIGTDFAIRPDLSDVDRLTQADFDDLEEFAWPYLKLMREVMARGCHPLYHDTTYDSIDMFNYALWRWMMFFRHPSTKIRVGFALYSWLEQVGKDLLLQLLKYAVGQGNHITVKKSQISSSFNAHVAKALVHVQEARGLTENLWNELKNLITDSTIGLRMMNTDLYEIENCASVFFTTNYNDFLPKEMQDAKIIVHSIAIDEAKRQELREGGLYLEVIELLGADNRPNVAAIKKLIKYFYLLGDERFARMPFGLGKFKTYKIHSSDIESNQVLVIANIRSNTTNAQVFNDNGDPLADLIADMVKVASPPFHTTLTTANIVRGVAIKAFKEDATRQNVAPIRVPSTGGVGRKLGDLNIISIVTKPKLEHALLKGRDRNDENPRDQWIEACIEYETHKALLARFGAEGVVDNSVWANERAITAERVREWCNTFLTKTHYLRQVTVEKAQLCSPEDSHLTKISGNSTLMRQLEMPPDRDPHGSRKSAEFRSWLDLNGADLLSYTYESRAKLLAVRLKAVGSNTRWVGWLALCTQFAAKGSVIPPEDYPRIKIQGELGAS